MKSATKRTNGRVGATLFLLGIIGGIVAGLSTSGHTAANTSIPCFAKSRAVIANTGQAIHHANSSVTGDVQAALTIQQDAGATINGHKIPNTPAGLSQVAIPFGTTDLGTFLLNTGQSHNFTAGNYRAASFTLNSGSTVTVSGGIVQIWVTGALVMGGAANSNGTTQNLEFLVNSNNDVHINGGSSFSGLIYAPTAQVFVDALMHGSIVGSTTFLNSGGQVLFDANATCPCSSGLTSCSGVCVNTQTDSNNCGSCLNKCATGQTCVGGVCTCPSGQTICSGVCRNTQTDSNNCGTCGHVCSGGTSCVAGACVCPSGQTLCSGVCKNLQTDSSNCGTCGFVCAAGTTCQTGVCCGSGQTVCSGVCRSTQTDPNNCGTCGHVCSGGTSCVAGACVCPSGQTLCSGVCVNTQTDPNNCGTCGHVCPALNTCVAGQCVPPCSNGQVQCGNICTNTATDPNNCGGCGIVCAAGNTCLSSICIPPGSCAVSNAVTTLISGANVTAYVPRGSWLEQDPNQNLGVKVATLEGTGPFTTIPTVNPVNSCAANSATGRVVCTSNLSDVYLINGTTVTSTLTSSPSGTQNFSAGSCQTCGVAIDAVHNRAVVTIGIGSVGGLQFLDLATNTFGTPIGLGNLSSEGVLIDPLANLVLSASESQNYQVIGTNAPNTVSNFFQQSVPPNGDLESSAEDCSTGIALSTVEFTNALMLVNMAQASFNGTTWSAPSQFVPVQEFAQFNGGTTGIAVDSGTHLGVVTGELTGAGFGAIQLPSAPVSGVPSLVDWVAATVPPDPAGVLWRTGLEPHALTVYRSPTSGKSFAVLQNFARTFLAVVDLQALLMAPRSGGTRTVDPTFDLVGNNIIKFVALP